MKTHEFFKKHKILLTFLFLFLMAVFVYKKTVIWEEESEISLKKELSQETLKEKQPLPKKSSQSDSEQIPTVQVKGRITVSVAKERGEAFTDALVTLKDSTGSKILRRIETGKSGTVVFDEVPAGSYQVGAQRIGDGRVVSKPVNLEEGEITSVSLALYLDTEVTITVSVKGESGQPLVNQTFTLIKSGGPEFTVTTNENGQFTQGRVPPDDNWTLTSKSGQSVKFKVAPTAKDQTITVTIR